MIYDLVVYVYMYILYYYVLNGLLVMIAKHALSQYFCTSYNIYEGKSSYNNFFGTVEG